MEIELILRKLEDMGIFFVGLCDGCCSRWLYIILFGLVDDVVVSFGE